MNKQQQQMTMITMTMAITTTARVAATRTNSSKERERNLPSSELFSVVDKPLIPSESIGEVVPSCVLSSPVLVNALATVVLVFGVLAVGMLSNVVVTVQEFPIDGNLCSAA